MLNVVQCSVSNGNTVLLLQIDMQIAIAIQIAINTMNQIDMICKSKNCFEDREQLNTS